MNNDLLDIYLQEEDIDADEDSLDGSDDTGSDHGTDDNADGEGDVVMAANDANQMGEMQENFIVVEGFRFLTLAYRYLNDLRRNNNPFIPNIIFNLDDYDDSRCERMFRFQVDEIMDIADELRMPALFELDNRSKFGCLEGLCLVLRRIAYPCRFIDLVYMFGRSESMLSRTVNHVLRWIYTHWAALLLRWDHTRLTPAKLEQFAAAVHDAGGPLRRVIGFIDGTVRPIAQPVQGQDRDYNGHHRVHAMKYQVVTSPDGIIIHLSGPYQGRHHDLSMYRASGLHDILHLRAKDMEGNQMYIYGDQAYELKPVCQVPFPEYEIIPGQRVFNERMSEMRIAVEWSFGHVLQYFAFSDFKKSQRSLLSEVHLHYTVSVIFINIHSCMTGNNPSVGHFGVPPPTLEEYLHARNRH